MDMNAETAISHCANLAEIVASIDCIRQSVELLREASKSSTLSDIEVELEWLAKSTLEVKTRGAELLRELGGVADIAKAVAGLTWDARLLRRSWAARETQQAMVQLDLLAHQLSTLAHACRTATTAIVLATLRLDR